MEICNPGFIGEIVVGQQQVTTETPAIEANQLVEETAEGFQFVSPVEVFSYFTPYGEGLGYYFAGQSATQTTTTVDQTQLVALCNVVDRWTIRQLSGTEREESVPLSDENLFETYPALRRMSRGENWQLVLETTKGLSVLAPSTIFWVDKTGKRSVFFDLSVQQDLYLEFLFQTQIPTQLLSAALILKEASDESLAAQIDAIAVDDLIARADDYLRYYTRNLAPFLVNGEGAVQTLSAELESTQAIASSVAQLQLIHAYLMAYRATGDANYQEYALFLTNALTSLFYQTGIPASDEAWAPHTFVNAGVPFLSQGPTAADPSNYGAFESLEFVNGVAQAPADLAEVYQVYTGELSWANIDADLISGKTYAIDYWVDAANSVQAAEPQSDRELPHQGNIIYTSPRRDAMLIVPLYSSFALGVY